MKKALIGGSLLAVFLLMMLPSVAAEEANVVQSAAKSTNLLNVQISYLEAIRAKYLDNPTPQCILLTLAILVLKLIRWGVIISDLIILTIILKIIRGNNNTTAALC